MRVRTSPLTLAALLTCLGSAAPAAGQNAVHLRYSLQEGQTFRTLLTTESETFQTFQGMEQSTKQTMIQGTVMEVLSVHGDGVARLRYTTESVHVSMETPMGLMEYDSSNPDAVAPPALNAFALSVGSVLTMSVGPDGSIRDVTGGDEMLERMLDSMSFPPGMTKESMREGMRAQFGDDAMASVTTVTGRAGGTVTLSIESTLSSDSESVMALAGMTQRYDVAGTSTGTTEIEESTGMYLRSRSEMTMAGTISTAAGALDMSIPMSSRTVMTVERVPAG